MPRYERKDCYKCGIPLVVSVLDVSDYNYCTTCAWDKMNYQPYDNHTDKEMQNG